MTRAPWLFPRRGLGEGLLVALLAVAIATAIRVLVDPLLPPGYPFLTYFPAVILTTLLWGLWPGMAAALLSAGLAWRLFMPGADLASGATWVALGFFMSVTAVDILIIYVMNKALRRLQEEQDRSARLARENEMMLREAQHRISNNLQMLAAILTLQRSAVTDPAARHALGEAANRLRLVGKIQRDLYHSAGDTEVETFLRELAVDALDAAGSDRAVCRVCAVPARLPADQLTPLGLVMLELIANAIEHGGGSGSALVIEVGLSRHGELYRLTVQDDGFGLPPGFDLDKTDSLGLRIVRAMASQLNGTFRFEAAGKGALAVLDFPAAEPEREPAAASA